MIAPILLRDFQISLSLFFLPYSVYSPDEGVCNPQISRMSVVLPAPFFPMKP